MYSNDYVYSSCPYFFMEFQKILIYVIGIGMTEKLYIQILEI